MHQHETKRENGDLEAAAQGPELLHAYLQPSIPVAGSPSADAGTKEAFPVTFLTASAVNKQGISRIEWMIKAWKGRTATGHERGRFPRNHAAKRPQGMSR